MLKSKRPDRDFREMREMLRAMQAGELTVSRGIEILEQWDAGNWSDDMLPPVRADICFDEGSMPVDVIDRLRSRLAEVQAAFQAYLDAHEECLDADEYVAMTCSMDAHHAAAEVLDPSEAPAS